MQENVASCTTILHKRLTRAVYCAINSLMRMYKGIYTEEKEHIMALTRKFLVAMGIDEAKIDEIINAHTEVTSALKQERDEYKVKAEQLDDVQKQLNKANEKLKEFEDSDDADSWQEKYNQAVEDKRKIEKDFNDYKQSVTAKETTAKKTDAYKQLLKDAGISEKRIDAVLKVSDISAIELDKEGKIKDVETLTENVKNEWSDFIVTAGKQGAETPNPPANNGGSSTRASVASQRVADFYKDRYGTTATKED